jgi:hypothetical protein
MVSLTRSPTKELEPLRPLTGRWASRGETIATAGEPSISIVGTDVYEWLGGGHFLEHRVHVRMGDEIVEVLEVIGEFDGTAYTMRSFDQEGAVAVMRATVADDGSMTFAGDTMRTTLTLASDGDSMQARWERADDDGSWSHWMDMRFSRI